MTTRVIKKRIIVSVAQLSMPHLVSWSLTGEANETALRLAQKYQVGLYNPSFEGPILLPQNGELKPMEDAFLQS